MEQQQQLKVERFLKLGYSHSDILRVLESLRHDAQTNDILEELIKTCHTRACSDKSGPNSPKLVARGCSPRPGPGPPRAWSERDPAAAFRPVVIDGSNVAMSHGDKKVFSCRGLQLAVNWFLDRGARDVTVFVPLWRKEQPRPEAPITDKHILHQLESRKILVYTPSRCVNGKRVVCYDDRYIVKLAFDSDGIVVSNDNYRDLQTEKPQWKRFIEERLLMYTFANDKFMPPDDPLGRNGPTIDDFLRNKPWPPDNKPQHCPYGRKCTYGVKCKFYHPERANQSQLPVADELRAQRDRARTYSPQACVQEAQACRCGSSSHRDSSSKPLLCQRSLQRCPSSDADEAFGSMESSVSRLCIQERSCGCSGCSSSGCSSSGCSSGCSLSHDSGSYDGGCSCRGGHVPHHGRCCQQAGSASHSHHYPPVWSSCPALLPNNGDYPGLSEKQRFRQPPSRHTHSLPRNPCSEQRAGLRQQLSTLFPQSDVEKVMSSYPRVSDVSELIALIQSYRSSHISY